ncbi:hypothetical protein [Kitasatospora sp. NPDC002040]|uniref:hypothetical protein n=1 Tax=Kitasatospora sp. NPDC002040 TaxID=3154661 RepID=UPI00332C3D38
MAELNPVTAWLQPTGQTRAHTRAAPLGAMAPGAGHRVNVRSGVLPGAEPFGLLEPSGMQFKLQSGKAVLQGGTFQGAYPVAWYGDDPLVLADGDAQFDRIDSVVLRVYDTGYEAAASDRAAIEIVRGTPAAAPVAPPLPAAPAVAIRLWDIRVRKGASSGTAIDWNLDVTDKRVWTVAVGGITPKDAGGANGGYQGQYRDNGGGLDRWDGTAWAEVGGWKAYTPNWTAETTNPVLGDGTVEARFTRIGRTVHVRGYLLTGTTTTYGSGRWQFSLPLTASAVPGYQIGQAQLSGPYRYVGQLMVSPNTGAVTVYSPGPTGSALQLVSSTYPFTWSGGGQLLRFTMTYEAI